MELLQDPAMADVLTKVGLFIIVQALVYLVLSSSSTVFSKNMKRSFSFKPARSVSIRRMLAAISDVPAATGGHSSTAENVMRRTPSSAYVQQLDPIFGDLGY
ncbi:hypothetical protein LINPERPRIM_LOCUS36878 [Linum perenne]